MSSGKKDVTKQIFELISEEHESEILSTANMHVVIYHQHIHLELNLMNFATLTIIFLVITVKLLSNNLYCIKSYINTADLT